MERGRLEIKVVYDTSFFLWSLLSFGLLDFGSWLLSGHNCWVVKSLSAVAF